MTQLEDDFLRRLDHEPLDANRLADRYQNLRAREDLLNRQHHRLRAAVDRSAGAGELNTLAADLHTEYQGFLSAFSWHERGEINRFPAGYPTPWRLAQLHCDREDLEAAGGRSPAAVYREAPESALDGLSPPAREVVNSLIDSDMSVQPLRILDDPHGYGLLGSRSIEGPFELADPPPDPHLTQAARRFSREGRQVLRAVALAAHYSGSRVLAVPATEAARSAAHNQRYAHHVADDPQTAIANLTSGQWKPPPGALIIVDDADEVAADELRGLCTLAGRTNTKLVLVSADRAGLGTTANPATANRAKTPTHCNTSCPGASTSANLAITSCAPPPQTTPAACSATCPPSISFPTTSPTNRPPRCSKATSRSWPHTALAAPSRRYTPARNCRTTASTDSAFKRSTQPWPVVNGSGDHLPGRRPPRLASRAPWRPNSDFA